MRKLLSSEEIFFITNEEGYANVLSQIQEIDGTFQAKRIIIEPKSLNTAPAMVCATQYLLLEMKIAPEEVIAFLPADHYIGNVEGYSAVLKEAMESVGDAIGTIGIRAVSPETGYGYIRKGERQGGSFAVREFCEKPDRETAKAYLSSGEYVWNSGMYIMSAKTLLREITTHAPDIVPFLKKDWKTFVEDFHSLSSISFDYAVSEKSKNVVVFEGDFGWSDIGSFDSLADIKNGVSSARHIGIDSKNVLVHSENDRLVATIGVEDMAIIETKDSILVYRRGRAEDVKKIVEKLKESKAKELEYDFDENDQK